MNKIWPNLGNIKKRLRIPPALHNPTQFFVFFLIPFHQFHVKYIPRQYHRTPDYNFLCFVFVIEVMMEWLFCGGDGEMVTFQPFDIFWWCFLSTDKNPIVVVLECMLWRYCQVPTGGNRSQRILFTLDKISANFPSKAKTSNLAATERRFLVSFLKGLCFQSIRDCSDFLHQRILSPDKYRLLLWQRWLSLHDPRDGKRPSFRLLCTPIISL